MIATPSVPPVSRVASLTAEPTPPTSTNSSKARSRRRWHFHHGNEEPLFVLAGTPTLRRGPGDERTLEPGEVVSFPAGPDGVHQVLNRAPEPARVLIAATNDVPEVAEQAENQQLAVITVDGLRVLPRTAPINAAPGAQHDE